MELMTRTISDECARITNLFDVDLSRVHSIITAALSESEGTISQAVRCTKDCVPVERTWNVLGLSPGGLYSQPQAEIIVFTNWFAFFSNK